MKTMIMKTYYNNANCEDSGSLLEIAGADNKQGVGPKERRANSTV